MKEGFLLLWLLYITIMTVVSWFTTVTDFSGFVLTLIVWMFTVVISIAIVEGF